MHKSSTLGSTNKAKENQTIMFEDILWYSVSVLKVVCSWLSHEVYIGGKNTYTEVFCKKKVFLEIS